MLRWLRARSQVSSPAAASQRVAGEDLLAQPVGENWTSYNGDYTGRRYSTLQLITRQTSSA